VAGNEPLYVIKKIVRPVHAHHGGAWKIAYADFVTAMMAFFLLLWLISMTTPEQKKGIADYFAPPNVSVSTSGAGGILGGTAMDNTSDKMSGSSTDATTFTAPDSKRKSGPMVAVRGGGQGETGDEPAPNSSQSDLQSHYDQEFQGAAASIRQAWQAMPDITDLADNLVLEVNKNGLNIKIKDMDGHPMFPEGSKFPYEATRRAIAILGPILEKLPNQITISGFTAAGAKYSDPHYGAWELSADRADVVRDILTEAGLSDDHISGVTGRATSDPLFPDDPYLAGNARVEITALYAPPPAPPGLAP
jgi:chemotaxis protein MotB